MKIRKLPISIKSFSPRESGKILTYDKKGKPVWILPKKEGK